MPEIAYTVKKAGILKGGAHVYFNCPGCGDELHAPLVNAGKQDRCTECAAVFTLPGLQTLNAHREAEQAEALRKQAKQEEEAKWKVTEDARRRARQREAEEARQRREAERQDLDEGKTNADRLRVHAGNLLTVAAITIIVCVSHLGSLLGEYESSYASPKSAVQEIAQLGYEQAQARRFLVFFACFVLAVLLCACSRLLKTFADWDDRNRARGA